MQAFCLATGLVFVRLHGGFLDGTTSLLFGTFLGITSDQVLVLAAFATIALAVLAGIARPLLFASVDRDVARACGTPTHALGLVFLVLLGTSAAAVSQITGALLVFALLVLPAATGQALADRPATSLAIAVGVAVGTVWVSLFVAYYTPYPVGFCLTTTGVGLYLAARWMRRPAC